MSTGPARQAHAIVAAFGAGSSRGGPWRLDRAAVADRLHELVADPARVRQGRLNLCGPAALCTVWLERDPVAAVTYATRLFEDGRARIGSLVVQPSRGLLDLPYGRTERALSCPQADWMMMAALRDSSNRLVRYSRPGGRREAVAAMTMPGALRRWLLATELFSDVHDETSLVRPKGLGHAGGLVPTPDQDLLLLVAMEMLRKPVTPMQRARDRLVSLLPNHWLILRSSIEPAASGYVTFRFWSWGAEHCVVMDRASFGRCYHGSVTAAK